VGTDNTGSSMPFDRVTVVCVGDRLSLARDALATQPDIDVVCVPVELATATIEEARLRGGVVAVANVADVERLLAAGADEVIDVEVISSATVRAVVRRAQTRAAARPTGPAKVGMCDLSKVAFEVVALVQRHVDSVAEVTLDVPEIACVIPMDHGSAKEMIASLLRNALENIARAERGRGCIEVRVTLENDLVLLDVSDDGARLDPEVRRRALEGDPTAPASTPGLSLLVAANQIRHTGAEMLVDSSADSGTAVRVFFPASATTPRVYVSGKAS
jgi:signal transduction histidine kinase